MHHRFSKIVSLENGLPNKTRYNMQQRPCYYGWTIMKTWEKLGNSFFLGRKMLHTPVLRNHGEPKPCTKPCTLIIQRIVSMEKNTCHIPVNLKHSIIYLSVVFTKLRVGSQKLVFKGNWSISVKIYAIQ